jgi:hypothetical protein
MSGMRASPWVAALATLFAGAADAREPNVRGFKAYALPAYTIITHDESSARQVPSAVAKIDSLLAAFLQTDGRGNGAPLYVVLAPENLWVDYLEPSAAIAGEFVPGRFVNYVLIRNCRCGIDWLRRAVFHEYTHFYLHSHHRGILPLWFDEGLAQLVENTEFYGTRANLGRPPFAPKGWFPLGKLLQLNKSAVEYRSEATSSSVHIESWAVVHRGAIADAEFGKQMFTYLDAINDLQPIDEAVQSSFGLSVKQLDREMNLYLQRSYFSGKAFNVEWAKPEKLKPGRAMSELESLELLADVMLVSGFKPQRLVEVIDTASRRAPDSSAVLVLRMRLASRDRADDVLEQLLAQNEPRLSDAHIARGVGLALFERLRDLDADHALSVERRMRWSAKASALLDRALEASPGDAEAVWAFGMLAADGKRDLETALRRVEEMMAGVRFNSDLAMAAVLLNEARGQTGPMVSHLNDMARFSTSAEQRAWARSRIVAVGAGAK